MAAKLSGRPEHASGADRHPDEDARPFPRVDLAALAKQGVPEPELLCDDLLYRGGLHSLGGEPDAGKGTLFLHWTVLLLAAGQRVALIDEEGGREIVCEKLLALGATPEQLERLWYVEFPGRQWDEADWRGLDALCAELQPALVGFDSCGALLGAAGKDENHGLDVTPFYRGLMQAARKSNAAFVVVDHLTKIKTNGRYTRGSGAKLQLVDVAWFVEAVKPFSRKQNGLLKLSCQSKDRRGYLHRRHEVRVEVEDGTIALAFTKVEQAASDELRGLPPATLKIYAVLPEQPETATIPELTDRVAAKFGHGLHRSTVSTSLNQLAERKLADGEDGDRTEKRWWKVVS